MPFSPFNNCSRMALLTLLSDYKLMFFSLSENAVVTTDETAAGDKNELNPYTDALICLQR